MKLKIHNLFALFLIIGCISRFPMTLYSEMRGSVYGIITDKDTEEPLEGVKVFLHGFSNGKPSEGIFSQAKTNEKGYFRMDDIREGQFFIGCEKPGYATICPDYLFYPTNPVPEVDAFNIKEGQVKYLKIQMERGGSLKVVVQRKDESGIKGYQNDELVVKVKNKQQKFFPIHLGDLETDENGVCIIKDLAPGSIIRIRVMEDGFRDLTKDIVIKKNEIIEYVGLFDYTEKPVLIGKIFFSNKELVSADLMLASERDKYGIFFDITHQRDYQFRNLISGDYILVASYFYEGENVQILKYPVRIEEGETMIFDLYLFEKGKKK